MIQRNDSVVEFVVVKDVSLSLSCGIAGRVHLSGYLVPEADDDFYASSSDDDSSDGKL